MEKQDTRPRELAFSLLKLEAGHSPDQIRLAHAADRILQKLRGELVPLIGPIGFSAVLGRALRQTQREFPFLNTTELASEEGADLKGLPDTIKAVDHVQAEAATLAILANLLAVLAEIIGWDMTCRAVRD